MITRAKELQLESSIGEDNHYHVALALTFKGNKFEVQNVIKAFTIIDVYNNAFYGEIARELGDLNALIVLNVSHNSLSGNIPSSFGNLS